ncbi:beta-1,3 exoglucanase [Fusarium fujikuroi]|nr:beta-1,3 exoglucanase [Fusarium fujikuroi]
MFSLRTIVAGATIALAGMAQATHIDYPPCLDPFQPYVSSGCYMDGVEGHMGGALIYRSGQNQYNMTVEKCVAECKGNGFRYAGLKYYGVCYCGSTVGGIQLPDSQCNYPCTGDKTETCGSDNAFSIWQDPTFKLTNLGGVVTQLQGTVQSIAGYKPNGCYTDNSSKGRALTWPMDIDGSQMTPTSCLTACADQGFPFAGLEYGGECYCGNVLANDTVKADVGDCNVPCNGDKTLLCGGPSRLSVYVAEDLLSLQPCGWKPSNSASASASVSLWSSTSTTSATTSNIATSSSSTTIPVVNSGSSVTSSSTTLSTLTSTTGNGQSSTTGQPSGPSGPSGPSVPSSTTNKPPGPSNPSSTNGNGQSTTNKPSTTTTTSCSTTTGPAMCTSTVVVPNTCEYKCERWLARRSELLRLLQVV